MASPVVKWVGGKTKLLLALRARMPKTYGRYYEPFAGGAALFFALEPEKATLGDANSALVEMYQGVASDVESVLGHLAEFRGHYQTRAEAYYYEMRTCWNTGAWRGNPPARAAAFIFLNKTCFNGLWRVNKSGEFNVPAGKYKNPGIFDAEAMRAVVPLLKRTHILTAPFEVTTTEARKGDLVYFDPPYDPIDKTSNFTSYTKEGFGDDMQERLALHVETLHRRGVHVMVSNNDTPMIRNLYAGFKIETVKCARPINSKGDKRGEVDEVIITNEAS